MKKLYDTCALLDNYTEIFKKKEEFAIYYLTTVELENIKTSIHKDEETKYRARKLLDLMYLNADLFETVLPSQAMTDYLEEYSELPRNNDTEILLSAKLKKYEFVTSDLACYTIAKSIGVPSTYLRDFSDDEYKGYVKLSVDNEQMSYFYSTTLQNNINDFELLENEYLLIEDKNTKEIVDKYKWCNNIYQKVNYVSFCSSMFGKVTPKDNDIFQLLAMDSLKSNQITLIKGPAGSGKSWLSFAYMFSLLEHGKIDKIIIFCNTVATKGSAKLGFYPGSRTEKLLDSQIGNFLASKITRFETEKMIDEGTLVLLPVSDIRGYDTTGMNAAVYITEAQNLDIELMKLALQRIGEDSICILDGDVKAQVDLGAYAGANNGMRRVSEIFRGKDIYGEVELKTIKRSKIAEIADLM